jgi:hypothetical protein
MGRRWGKSTLGGAVSLACANMGAKVAWTVPTYRNGRPLWRWAENVCRPLIPARVEINRTDRMISFPSGGFLGIYTADNPTGILGESFHVVVVDEAARIAEEVWTETLLPTLADHDGRAILISTPHGRNWFWEEWQRGQLENGAIKSWRAPSSANPNPRIQKAAELAKERVPNQTYRQEWLAEFVDDGLALLTIDDINRATVGAQGEQPRKDGHTYVTSVDLGRKRDTTVINTFDTTLIPYQRVAFDRIERVPWPKIQEAIEKRVKTYGGRTFVESNGIGDPVIGNLNVSVEEFITSSKSKYNALKALQLLFERGNIKARWDARERQALIKAAWDDDHTADEVMSLAIGAANLEKVLQVFL